MSARPRPHSPASPAPDGTAGDTSATTNAAAAEVKAANALANQLFGEPERVTLLRQEGALEVLGWILGRGRADCREAGQLAHIVGIDVVLIGDGRYAVSERTATDGVDGMSRLEAQCELFASATAARRYCEEGAGDDTQKAARAAALDHAVRRWPPFRGVAAVDRLLRIPFLLD
jgi:hypothetical protein